MRWIAICAILVSFPLFFTWLGQGGTKRRNQALMAIGVMVFLAGTLQIDASPIAWRLWQGTVRGITISPVDTLGLALILTRRHSSTGLPFQVLLAIYALPVMISIAVASAPMAATFVFFQLLRMAILLIAVGGELARPGAVRHLLIGMSIGLMIQAGFVIEQKMSGVVQASGLMAHQNILGLMVELAVLPLIAAVMGGERNKLIYAGIAAGLICVASGGSRAAVALLGAGIVVLALVSLARSATPRKFQIIGLGMLAVGLFAALSLATLKDRFGEASLVSQETQRAALERAARAMASAHPFGVGANHYVTAANTQGYASEAGVAWSTNNRAAPVHNAYLLARAETGWFGQFALMTLLIVPAAAGIRLAFRNRKGIAGEITLGAAVAIALVGVHNTVEYAWHVYNPQAIFFLNMAIIAGMIRAGRIERQALRKRKNIGSAGRRPHAISDFSRQAGHLAIP